MRTKLPFGLWLALVLACPASAAEPEGDFARLVGEARKSVAWLIPRKDGLEYHATGFVVARPGDGKKVILTAGHVYQNGMALTARLPGMARPVPCELIAVSPKHDLMAVWPLIPIDNPALPLLDAQDVPPKLGDPIVTIGCPGGLDWEHFRGEINGEPITAADLQKRLGVSNFNGRTSPFGDAVLLRHNAFSSPGMSGGPVLDRRGRVIGVQIGTLPKASNVSFGIHAKHAADLDLNAAPRPFSKGPELSSDIGHVLAIEKHADQPLLLRVGDEEVDARCSHFGYVPKDADTVIGRYVQDEKRFRELFTKERLQKLLDDTPVAHITNPAFGFRVLVPKGYVYGIEESKRPTGIVVTFTSGDPAVAPPYNTITIRAFLNTEYALRAKRLFDEKIRSGDLKYPNGARDDAFLRTEYRKGCIEGIQLGMVSTRFPFEVLGIRVRDENGRVYGNPDHELFEAHSALSPNIGKTAWVRHNYDATEGPVAHAVHCGLFENVIVVVHYQFLKKDRERFFAGKDPSSNFLERAFIASTVSLY
jgi:hypothetical protein